MARPGQQTASIVPGEHRLDLDGGRDGVLYVPRGFQPGAPVPLAIMLHGAGGTGDAMRFTFALADEFGVPLLAPDSRGRTWDVILGGFGPDVEFINAALAYAFERMAVDPARIGIGGFSANAASRGSSSRTGPEMRCCRSIGPAARSFPISSDAGTT
jgi:poly(3-hydroxybutyrate) depolymerase